MLRSQNRAWNIMSTRLYCARYPPDIATNSLLARSYNNVFDWLKIPVYLQEIVISGNFQFRLSNDFMWLLHTRNSIRIGVEVTSSLDNVCGDYLTIATADFLPIEICVGDDVTYPIRIDQFCLRLQTVFREYRNKVW